MVKYQDLSVFWRFENIATVYVYPVVRRKKQEYVSSIPAEQV